MSSRSPSRGKGAYMHVIPHSWSHLHILVTVFPSVGLLFALGFYAAAILTANELLKRACLLAFVILGLLAIPAYLSGDYSAEALSADPRVAKDIIDYHYGWGVTSLALLVVTALVAFINLFRFRGVPLSDNALHLVLGLAILTLCLMAVV